MPVPPTLELDLHFTTKGVPVMDIYKLLASKPHNPHYLNRYITFIKQCQQKNVGYEGYVERHHICPKADDMFPEYEDFRLHPWNKAPLTPRQHFIAHLMLWKSFPNILSCLDAIWGMKCRREIFCNSRLYESLRIEAINLLSSRMKGKAIVKDLDNPDRGFFQIDTENEEYLTNNRLVGIAKGLVIVKNPDNPSRGYFRVSADNSDYVSGKYIPYMKGTVTVKDPNDTLRGYFRVSIDDPDYLSGRYVSYMKGLVLVKDIKEPQKGSFFVSLDDRKYVSGEYIAVAQKGYTVAKDPNDTSRGYFKIATDDPDYISGKYISYMKGTVTVKDPNNPDRGIFHTSVDDPSYLSGEFEHFMKGRVTVKDPENPERGYFQVEINDPDYVSGRYIPSSVGKVTVKDLKDPNRGYFQVETDNPYYVSGEYVPFRLGQKRTEKNLVFAIDLNGNKIKVPSDDKRLDVDLRRLSTPDVLYLLETGEKKWLPRYNNCNVKSIIFENKDYFKRKNRGKYDFYTPWGLFSSHKEALNHMPSSYNFSKIEIYNFCVNSKRIVKERHIQFFGSLKENVSIGATFADHGFFTKPKFVIPKFD